MDARAQYTFAGSAEHQRGVSSGRTAWTTGLGHFRGFTLILVLIGLAIAVGFFLFKQHVHEQVRVKIEQKLNAKLSTVGAVCSVEYARFINGKGIRIRNVAIHDPANQGSSITIDEIEISSHACYVDLVGDKVCPTKVIIKGAAISDDVRNSNIERWLSALMDDPEQPTIDFVPIQIRNSEISIAGLLDSSQSPVTFHKIDLDIFPVDTAPDSMMTNAATTAAATDPTTTQEPSENEIPPLKLRGSLKGNLVDKISINGLIDWPGDQFNVNVNAENASLDGRILQQLPAELKDKLGPLTDMKGVVNFSGNCGGRFSQPDQVKFNIDGRLSHANINSPKLPFPVVDGHAKFDIWESGIKVTNVAANFGLGSISLHYEQAGLLAIDGYYMKGKVERFFIDKHVNRFLPSQVAEARDKLSFDGEVNASYEVRLANGNESKQLTVELLNTSFAFDSFPFRFNHCLGTINWDGQICTYKAEAIENDQIISFQGRVPTVDHIKNGFMEVTVNGEIPIDEKLINAFHTFPDSQKTLREFHPTGKFGYFGRFDQNSEPGADWSSHHYITLNQCGLRYDHFDYPIHNVGGKIEVVNGTVYYKDVTGDHNGGALRFNGTWKSDEGLKLNVAGKTIAFDEDLRSALPDQYRSLWNQLRPQGSLDDVKVDFFVPPGSREVQAVIEAQKFRQNNPGINGFAVKPTGFPYAINRLSGWFKVENGRLVMRNVQGHHGTTWFQSDGSGEFSDNGWSITLENLIASGVKVDHELLSALPTSLSNSIRSVQFNGQINLQGNLRFGQFRNMPNSRNGQFVNSGNINEFSYHPFFEWRDLRIDLDGANIFVGMPITNLRGSVSLTGHSSPDSTKSGGRISLDSITLNDIQITNLRGPLWFDETRLNFGTFAQVSSDTLPGTITGDVFGGRLAWDAQFSLQDDQRFFLQTTLAEADLQKFASEQMPARTDMSGSGYMTMQLGGSCKNIHSLKGNGSVQLRNAKIYQIPVILSLLKILSVSEMNRTAFNESNIDFTLQGEDIDFQKIELIGDAVSLIGNGKLDLSRNIDLNFYTVVGRNRWYIPIVSQLYEASSQQILLLRVDGTLDNPQTHRDVIPHINDSLQSFFDELNPNKSSKRGSGFRLTNPFNR